MNDPTTPTSPWAPPIAKASDVPVGTDVSAVGVRLQNPLALFAVAASLGIALAVAMGWAIGGAIFASSTSSCTPSDGWCEFGAALIGLAAGVLVGAVTYVAAGVVTIARCRPKGRRASHVAGHLAFPFAVFAGLALLDALAAMVI